MFSFQFAVILAFVPQANKRVSVAPLRQKDCSSSSCATCSCAKSPAQVVLRADNRNDIAVWSRLGRPGSRPTTAGAPMPFPIRAHGTFAARLCLWSGKACLEAAMADHWLHTRDPISDDEGAYGRVGDRLGDRIGRRLVTLALQRLIIRANRFMPSSGRTPGTRHELLLGFLSLPGFVSPSSILPRRYRRTSEILALGSSRAFGTAGRRIADHARRKFLREQGVAFLRDFSRHGEMPRHHAKHEHDAYRRAQSIHGDLPSSAEVRRVPLAVALVQGRSRRVGDDSRRKAASRESSCNADSAGDGSGDAAH